MPKSKMREVEEQYKMPLRDVLKAQFEQCGTVMKVAMNLGVSQGTVSSWLMRNQLEVRSVLVDLAKTEAQS